MMRRLFARWAGLGRPDPEGLYAELHAAFPGKGKYTELDRYRDFRAVFLSTDQGRRVLHQIFTWCHMDHSSLTGSPIDSSAVVAAEGERNIGIRILTALNHEPSEQPTETGKLKWPKK